MRDLIKICKEGIGFPYEKYLSYLTYEVSKPTPGILLSFSFPDGGFRKF